MRVFIAIAMRVYICTVRFSLFVPFDGSRLYKEARFDANASAVTMTSGDTILELFKIAAVSKAIDLQ